MQSLMHTYTHTHRYMLLFAHTHIYTHSYTHTYMHIHVHIHMLIATALHSAYAFVSVINPASPQSGKNKVLVRTVHLTHLILILGPQINLDSFSQLQMKNAKIFTSRIDNFPSLVMRASSLPHLYTPSQFSCFTTLLKIVHSSDLPRH